MAETAVRAHLRYTTHLAVVQVLSSSKGVLCEVVWHVEHRLILISDMFISLCQQTLATVAIAFKVVLACTFAQGLVYYSVTTR